MKDALILLKEKFCQGDRSTIYEMVELVFPQLWLHIISNTSHPKADHIGGLIERIYNNPDLLCNTEESVDVFLTKQLNKVSRETISRDGEFYEGKDYIAKADEQEDKSESQMDTYTGHLPIHAIFQSSLDEIAKICYEIIYVQKWKQRPGSRQLLLFLVNALSFGNYDLLKTLKGHPANYPEILSWFVGRLKEMFYKEKNVVENWDTFSNSEFFNIEQTLENRLKTQIQTLKRNRSDYGELRMDLAREKWSEMEIYFYLIYKYVGLESFVEIWLQMNIYAKMDKNLQVELEHKGLWKNEVQPTDEGMKHIKIFVSLTHLELWNCEITGRGAEELQNLKFLKHLCLSRNKIKDDGIHNIKDI